MKLRTVVVSSVISLVIGGFIGYLSVKRVSTNNEQNDVNSAFQNAFVSLQMASSLANKTDFKVPNSQSVIHIKEYIANAAGLIDGVSWEVQRCTTVPQSRLDILSSALSFVGQVFFQIDTTSSYKNTSPETKASIQWINQLTQDFQSSRPDFARNMPNIVNKAIAQYKSYSDVPGWNTVYQ
ncbi:hypothetical protein SAMN04489725_1259 [Alicyclobacillus hesperidum]|uniref:Uncharacterized protein n=1 Tax=Alicyclobacillus hesperidum TaxID=89784 RepID=A0A1H2XWL9_9BACL|nr:hypothetical protein [Alicyclobacillus hesperidum]SDW97266.1 hypothetical protein SAMN04489725_1259 [Alicyclobacillus hesperidum]